MKRSLPEQIFALQKIERVNQLSYARIRNVLYRVYSALTTSDACTTLEIDMDRIKRAVAAFFDFLQGIVVVMAVLVMIYLFLVSPQEINGASMEPNFHNGEYILTNKVLYKFREPQRGDVIIFKSPRNKEIDYIKRIIGLPGDIVKLENNSLYVNGQKVEEPYLAPGISIFGGSYLAEGQEIVVPPGEYFVAGDNRPHSSDSREFGPIALEDFIGVAFLRYFPFDRAGLVPKPIYEGL